jgi:hypothetical protein
VDSSEIDPSGIMIMKKSALALKFCILLLAFAKCALAEPTSGAVAVETVRPYMDIGTAGYVFFRVVPSTGFCTVQGASGADWYIDLSKNGGKATYAALLLAKSMDKQILVELSNQDGCTMAAGHLAVQSIYLR